MKIFLLVILVVTASPLLSPAQHDVGVKLNAGISKIITEQDWDYLSLEFNFEF